MRRVGLHLTDRCQLDCDHCLRDPGKEPVDLALSIVESVLRESAEQHGIRRVSLTGGEPTLHPRFPEVLDLAVRHGMTWDMVTNGRRFERVAGWLDEAPARLAACGSVVFSVDGASDAVHDGIRGAGQRREVLEAMAIAVAMGIPFATATTLHARNVSEIEEIAAECAGLGARSVRFAVLQPTGTHLDQGLRLSPTAWREARDRILSLASRGAPVVLAEGWPESASELCGPLRGDTLHVDVQGRLTMCCLHSGTPRGAVDETIAGDLGREGLDVALKRLEPIQAAAIRGRQQASVDPWADFQCNACLGRFGRPHWTGDGAGGAAARRERWRGDPDRGSPPRRVLDVVR